MTSDRVVQFIEEVSSRNGETFLVHEYVHTDLKYLFVFFQGGMKHMLFLTG